MSDFNELLRIQKQMSARIMREAAVDRKVEFMDLLANLNVDKKGRIHLETALFEARTRGYDDDESLSLIEELKKEGFIKEDEPGYLRINI